MLQAFSAGHGAMGLYVANKFIMVIIPNFTLLFLRYLLAAVCLTIVHCFCDPGKAAKPIKIARGLQIYPAAWAGRLWGFGWYAAARHQTERSVAGLADQLHQPDFHCGVCNCPTARTGHGAQTCSLFYPIQPLASTALGILILHEEITPLFLAGAALILFGIVYSSLRDRKE